VCLDTGPPYDYLRCDVDVLVLDLGCGEFRHDSLPGPTRNPGEWLRVLKEENRPLFAFLLTADWPAVEIRARAECARGVTQESARFSHDRYSARHEAVTFPTEAGISEYRIDTSHMEADKVAAEIRNVVNQRRPFQWWQ